jgi:hypothetical protein
MSLLVIRKRVWSMAAIICGITTCACCMTSAEDSPTAAKLPETARSAKAAFRPLTQTNLKDARQTLQQAAQRLDQRLPANAENGAAWRKYVRLDQLLQQLQREQPDAAALAAIHEKLNAGYEGLRLREFIDVRQALMHYLEIANALGNSDLQRDYDKLMDDLAGHLETYAAKPTVEEALMIGRALAWLENTEQAPLVVQAIRQHYVQPNLWLELSAETVAAGIAGPVDDVRPLHDCILGTNLSGVGHTTGETVCKLIPDPERGLVDTILQATTVSPTVGSHPPVEIHSNSVTRVGACKRMWVDANGVSSYPAVSNAVTATAICGICATRGGAMVERAAWRRSESQMGEAQQIAARHAEQRVNQQVDEQAAPMLSRANDSFVQKFRKPLVEHKLFPEELRFSTTSDALHIVSLEADASQLAAPSPAPALTATGDLALRVHESMINNVAARALAGMTVHEDSFRARMTDLLGELPASMKADEDEEPWTVTFAAERPITVTFADEGFTIVIRGDRYYRGKDSTPGLIVTAVYKFVQSGQQFKAERQGPLTFTSTSGKSLSGREIVVRTLLEQRLNKLLKEELLAEGFRLPGKWEKAGTMQPTQVVSKEGWLSVLWKAVPSVAASTASR